MAVNFSILHRVQIGSGVHPTGAVSLWVKLPEREADHSRPSSTEVKNVWNYISTPPILLHGVLLS